MIIATLYQLLHDAVEHYEAAHEMCREAHEKLGTEDGAHEASELLTAAAHRRVAAEDDVRTAWEAVQKLGKW